MKLFRSLFVIISIEGLLVLVAAFLSPPDSPVTVFLWFSRTRIILLLSLLGVWLSSLGILLWSWRAVEQANSVLARVDPWCLEGNKTVPALIVLLISPIVFLTVIFALNSISVEGERYPVWAPVTFPIVYAIAHRFVLLWLLLGVISIEFALFLLARYRVTVLSPEAWSWNVTGPIFLGLLIGITLVFHWTLLILQLRFFVNLPAWYWSIDVRRFTTRDLWFALVILGMLALAYPILISRGHVKRGLLVVFLLGCILQFGIGWISGGGIRSLRERYFSSYHAAYPLRASQNHLALVETVRRYEEIYAPSMFTSTKPPGLMVFYIFLERLVNGHSTAYTDNVRFERLSWAITYSFPIAGMTMVFLIYAFAKRFLNHSHPLLSRVAPLLYIFCPNIVLFSLFVDQAVYPILFLLGVWFIVFAIQRQSFLWAFILGGLLYALAFFAFTMLPLYLVAAAYLGLDYLANRKERQVSKPIGMALSLAAGTIFLYTVFLLGLNYDFFPRFERTVQINHDFDFYTRVGQTPPNTPETLPVRVEQIMKAAWVNNLDFAAAVGFPLYILSVVQGVRLIINFIKSNLMPGEPILLALFLSFVALNLAGTAQGEVARLWIFWVPMVILLAALEIEKWVQKKGVIVWILAATGFITILLTYHFQDLLM